ncbi:EGF-like domain-containing protein [Caerostris extrusa]|uniref:EGF-like domain-containing protein n=1 Tax=Caerostris extrusa TaxID=172846 RepID=A0AAV4XYY2_CAEEX|nr:EGF-like domain-containing protein [Caerostris extrusa]
MEKWHDSNSQRSIDTNVDEITEKPSLKMAIIRELEDELKETESSAHTSTISSSFYNSFTNTRALNKLAAENDILQKRVATLFLNKTIPGLNSSECFRCSRLTLQNAILKEETTEKNHSNILMKRLLNNTPYSLSVPLEGIPSALHGFPIGLFAYRTHKIMSEVVPAYPCDEWDKSTRTCWLDRNVGDTVTLVLAFHSKDKPKVQWSQEFHVFQSPRTEKYIIDEENPLWNIVIGSKGHEMRISPITEIDIDFNYFKASIVHTRPRPADEFEIGPDVLQTDTVNFRIRVMPLDQGFVYPGESLSLNMKRVNLPPSGMKFKWFLEKDGESGTLPSNMRVSPTGAVLTIAELRKEQEGILACAVYTNMDIFATKLRFLIKEINQNKLARDPQRDNEDSDIAYLQQNMQNPLQNKDNPPGNFQKLEPAVKDMEDLLSKSMNYENPYQNIVMGNIGVILPDNPQQDLLLGNYSEDILTKNRNYEKPETRILQYGMYRITP